MEELIKSARRKTVGAKQTLKALEKGEALHVFIATDAEEKVTRPVLAICENSGIKPHYVETMHQLGKLCGIKVKAAVAAITEE
ncbi:MAG: 50S ribosomal protein L7Ae-like protein [Firmicutes bacterium]|nr:50S ribosomal protein L7Ae-like protein [Bacillota bacterium]